jgi:hypothetical protein
VCIGNGAGYSHGEQGSRVLTYLGRYVADYSSQLRQRGGRTAIVNVSERCTARSFGSSTEIVSRASLQSRRSERGRTVVVHGCWISSARKAARLSSCVMDRSMTAGDSFDMTGENAIADWVL